MRTLTRYASIEFLKVFLIALTGMTVFLFLVIGAREAVRNGLGPGPILKVMPYILPESMRFSIPAAALLAACSTYGRMAGDNEIVAIKSLGISPMALVAPTLFLALLISFFAVWTSDLARSWGLPGRKRTVIESIEQIVYGMLRTGRSYNDHRFSITVKGVVGRRLIKPRLTIKDADGAENLVVSAREAQLRYHAEQHVLVVKLTDGSFDRRSSQWEYLSPGTDQLRIPLDPRYGERAQGRPSDCPLGQLAAERKKQQDYIAITEQSLAAEAAYQLLSGDLASLGGDGWRARTGVLDAARYRLNRLRTEPWRRWANGFSSFFFVIVGVPLSIRRRNSDFMTSFFLCFMPILLVYYPIMMYGAESAKEGALPQYAVWLGNVICLVWGAWLLRRVVQH